MKVIKGNSIDYISASHEDPKNPGVLKKVLANKADLISGRVQMVNWALLPKGKSFAGHYHEDMQEIFIIFKGTIKATVGNDAAVLESGDALIVELGEVHKFENISESDVEYLAIGISQEKGGKTIVV